MPMYDFFCPRCDKNFDELVAPGERPPCPICGCTESKAYMSAPSPLKTGAFPFKPGPVHPLGQKMAAAQGCGGGGCGGSGFS